LRTFTSTVTAKPGLSAAEGSSGGWRGAISRRRKAEVLQSALNVLEAKAHFDAPERHVHIRVGAHEARLYRNLCDAN
jgi:hypothetical protein